MPVSPLPRQILRLLNLVKEGAADTWGEGGDVTPNTPAFPNIVGYLLGWKLTLNALTLTSDSNHNQYCAYLSFFAVSTGVRQGCVLAPSLFNACMDWVLDKVVDQSDCGASVGNTKIADLVFADDAVIFAESLEVLVMALEALHEEAEPLGLEVSWLKTKVQVFGDLLDEAVQSVHACGEDIEILESFTYLGSAVHNDGGSRQEVLRRIGIAHGTLP
ncbi:Retrovirus-related Pol polyprotein from type-1 retrotransposable element R2 [Chionoecetes opilio]|uniref:Retrovirus-related Pol polyprotein from type-1 retrotransposable element R2 n=1 Tax=Chionoecetes opilio TaxID=41210 RepID=A0A8J5D4P1_CHIOP|nr:Retrovirus-related Pol polyprotein from type-1 retrotransposable element R2 [Chionoecetes opilio]